MGRKTALTCQSTKLNIVIRKNKELALSKIDAYCQETFSRYAFIEHKGDIKPDTGEIEGVHYHIVGDAKENKIPFSTRLNTIVKYFGFNDANGIQIEKYITFEGSLQYLTHKNQPEKTPHDIKEIKHNLSEEDFKIFYEADIGNVITFDLLYCACLNANNIIEVIKELGIGNYRTYRSVIWDMWNCLNGSPDTLKRL